MPLRESQGWEMSALSKGFEHKTEQSKLKMMSSNPCTCHTFITMPTAGRLSKACLVHCWVERACVYACTHTHTNPCAVLSIVRQKKKKKKTGSSTALLKTY